MKKEQIEELFQKFERARAILNGIECWSARELQEILGYSKWSNFQGVIEKAKNHVSSQAAKPRTILPMSVKWSTWEAVRNAIRSGIRLLVFRSICMRKGLFE